MDGKGLLLGPMKLWFRFQVECACCDLFIPTNDKDWVTPIGEADAIRCSV